MLNRYTLLLVICTFSFSCGEDERANTPDLSSLAGFEVIERKDSGITFQNQLADDPTSENNILSFEYYFNGAGVGIGDFNNDGLSDVFFAGNEVPNELYINKGDFKFEKLGPDSGINDGKNWAAGVSIVDINQDGFSDIYVCQQGPYNAAQRKNRFYINNGDLSFTESASSMGLDDTNYSTHATFFDYDKDGDLDCYVLNESKYARDLLGNIRKELKDPKKLRAASGSLFENTGDLKFVDVTKKAGVLNYGYGLGVSISDLNGDNWPDIYVSNDYVIPDFLYINQKDGTFKESIKEYTKQISYFGMGCDIADINNDGLVDIAVVDMAAEDHFRDKTLMAGMNTELFKYYFYNLGYQYQYMFNSLQLNNGNNTFSNIAAMAGILKSDWSWASLLIDFNLDGFKDLYVTNGYRRYARDNDFRNTFKQYREQYNNEIPLEVREELYQKIPTIKLKNKLYINDGDLHFNDQDASFYHPEIETYSYGAATADFDNDGDLDLIINNVDQDVTLLKNLSIEKTNNNFIKISLLEKNQAKKYGAKIFITCSSGTQVQEYYFNRGYESCMQEICVFGIGKDDKVSEIKIIWPDGNIQYLKNQPANKHLKIAYSAGENITAQEQKQEKALFKSLSYEDLGLDFKHTENTFDDFEKEILLPQKQTSFGPAIASSDVNGDQLPDVFIGGAKGQPGKLYLQQKDGKFLASPSQPWINEAASEDVDAIFIDPNQDGHKDLLILSGGSGDFVGQEPLLLDRFYANNGKGEFFRIANVIPENPSASFAAIKGNIDQDPLHEILILGAAKPGLYPQVEKSILLNYQNNSYQDVTDKLIPQLNESPGLIRDAIWVDINKDNKLDLITVGEWQTIQVFINKGDKFEKSNSWGTENKFGWWRSIEASDLDKDGDIDLVVGNVGKNFKQKASKEHPLYLFSNDYDGNGTLDCVLAKDYNNKIVPARGRECSSEQMPFISEKFETYKDFALASVEDILGEEKINEGLKLKATDFNSYVLWNEGNKFRYEKLPALAQISPINDIHLTDLNNDNKVDIVIIGNDFNTEYETPRLDAGNGLVLLYENQHFNPVSIKESGFFAPRDSRKIKAVQYQDKELFLIANNNHFLDIFLRS